MRPACSGLKIAVIDTGVGIAHKDISTAMAPFRQVDGSLGRACEDAGLGLPLSDALRGCVAVARSRTATRRPPPP